MKILEIHTSKLPMEPTVREDAVQWLSSVTEGFTGAELENLCREAALLAMHESIKHAVVVSTIRLPRLFFYLLNFFLFYLTSQNIEPRAF